jgi:phenylacetate-coenzyme A ligase PaaK-like adenylate-forming protein
VSFSARELHAYVALAGIGALFKGDLQPDDVAQISTSARATLGNTCFAGAAARLGAQVYLTGVVDPALALSQLAERRRLAGRRSQTSVLQVYPSYLGELVECGLALGYVPNDFGLERIFVGGEIVTAGLKHRAEHLFGQAIRFGEGYAMTETWPLAGTRCSQGHLHFEPSQALLEVLDPDTQASSAPGEPGTAVVTPLPPYRETTLLLRYDTEDVVRALDAVPLTCELRNIPATSDVQGKLRLAARHEYGWTFPRDVLEVLEGMEEVPLPARCGFWAVPGGVAVEVLVRSDSLEVKRQIAQHLEDGGIPLRELNLVTDGRALRNPLPLRCDLREASFSTGQAEPLSAGIGLST